MSRITRAVKCSLSLLLASMVVTALLKIITISNSIEACPWQACRLPRTAEAHVFVKHRNVCLRLSLSKGTLNNKKWERVCFLHWAVHFGGSRERCSRLQPGEASFRAGWTAPREALCIVLWLSRVADFPALLPPPVPPPLSRAVARTASRLAVLTPADRRLCGSCHVKRALPLSLRKEGLALPLGPFSS